jgi:hypothetical protein
MHVCFPPLTTRTEEEEEKEEESKNHMVNPLLFGREDRSDEYGAIFGKDLEWFPNGLRVWRMERFFPKPVPGTPLPRPARLAHPSSLQCILSANS